MDPDYCPVCRGDLTVHSPGPPGLVSCPLCGGMVWSAGDDAPAEETISVTPETRRRVLTSLADWLSEDQLRVAERLLDGRSRADVVAELGVFDRTVRRIAVRVRTTLRELPDP